MIDRKLEDGGADATALIDHIKFEIKSFLGRTLSPKQRDPGHDLLHIGAGEIALDGFENLDFYAVRFWKKKSIGHDFRYPLPYADETFSGAFSEHTLEHMTPAAALHLSREIHRVLRSGSFFRCSVPDLGKYIAFYNGELPDAEFGRFSSGCGAIANLTQNYGHLSVWDADEMIAMLREAGFRTAEARKFGESADPRLAKELAERFWESLYVEAMK